MARGARNRRPTAVATVPTMMNAGPALVGEGEQEEARPPASRTAPAAAKRCAGWGRGGRPDRAATTEDPGHGPRRPPGRRHRGHDGEDQARADRPPRQVEAVDAVLDERLQRRREREPAGQAGHAARRRRRRRRRPRRWPACTRRTCRSVAPSEASMPRARSRRWAMTAKPATAIRPTKSSPRVPSTRTSASTAAWWLVPARFDADAGPARQPERRSLRTGLAVERGSTRGAAGSA